MCGITGIVHINANSRVDEDLLQRMNESQFHRGPDQSGVHVEPGVGLGHRRLSIIDLSGGRQPLYNEDHSVILIYNGEIYNFLDLAVELKSLGHIFRTHCDTEVIVHSWEQWGISCVERFRGMFAFAIWDRNRDTLFLARDRLGIKPLYYAMVDDRLLFASELKALLKARELPRLLDSNAVEDYFAFGYVPEPRTILQGVYKLPPGHTLTMVRHSGRTKIEQYWNLSFEADHSVDTTTAEHELVERIREAVKIRMIADVPLGAFLSGGVDSSSIVAMMAGLSNKQVQTCSIAFDDPNFDESQYARKVAARYSTHHFESMVHVDDFELLDKLSIIYDEPFADSSAIPTYRVCELARKEVTVALSGDGGDENLAGYRRYWHQSLEDRARGLMPYGLRRSLFGALAHFYPKADWAPRVFRAKTTFQALARDSVQGYFHNISLLKDQLRRKLYSNRLTSDLQGYSAIEVFRRYAGSAPVDDSISLIQYLDIKTYLVGDILTKVDRASMTHSLEVRVPLLDHKLVEWIARLPSNLKLRGSVGKWLLKNAMAPYLDQDVLFRRKMGFAVPIGPWFRGQLRERLRQKLLHGRLLDTGLFRQDTVTHLIDLHISGKRDYSSALWSLLIFESSLANLFDQ